MSIVVERPAVLTTYGVQDKVDLSYLIEKSTEYDAKWVNTVVDNSISPHYTVTPEQKLMVQSDKGVTVSFDLTVLALKQLCQRLGVPAAYIIKCFDDGQEKLAVKNLNTWIRGDKDGLMVRSADGVARGIVTPSYVPYKNSKILQQLRMSMDTERFIPSQVYLSQDGMQIRFVDFNPLPITDGTNSPLYAGFILRSSNVGTNAFSLRFFIYRFACTNGLVISKMGGDLFRIRHIGEAMKNEKISLFNKAFMDIDVLCSKAVDLVAANNSTHLKPYEMEAMIKTIKSDLKLSQEKTERLETIIATKYNNTRWGVINGITELAQDFSLDTRYDMEQWAGNFLAKGAKAA